MISLFLKTDKFWIFSRILLTLIFLVTGVIVLIEADFRPRLLINYSFFGIYLFLMILILVKRAFKNQIHYTVNLATGIMSILIGFLYSYTIITIDTMAELLKIGFHLFPIWMILFGLRDILLYRNNYRYINKRKIARNTY